ncbi:hypothetical protein F5Y01DRAFT_315092 [Xylaria sp. FL0043]|nr:hypothetical protein F5Y01DRAFT_315092 [Xylaria sp. FL0043]
MNPNHSTNCCEANVKGGDSHIEEMSDLIFSFDNDIETGFSTMDITSLEPSNSTSLRCSSPSSSQSGYVMISYPSPSVNAEPSFTDSYNPRISPRYHMARKDKSRRTRQMSSTTLPLHELPPSDTVNYPQRLSPLHLQAPQEPHHSPTPESTTPGTRQFQDNMLALLSLLPSERYLSPSPSNEEHQLEDKVEMHGQDSSADPAFLGSSAPNTTSSGPLGYHSPYSVSSCSMLEFYEESNEFGGS